MLMTMNLGLTEPP